MARRRRNDSAEAMQMVMQEIQREIEPPQGIVLRSDEERVIWGQFTRARSVNDWREVELMQLVKAVRLEVDIRRFQESLDRSGPLVRSTNKAGVFVENPLIKIIDTYQRQLFVILRMLSLTKQADARTIYQNAIIENTVRNNMANMQKDEDSLLATPLQ